MNLLPPDPAQAQAPAPAGTVTPAASAALPAGLTLESDPDHLYRIAANLLRNAAEAMETITKITRSSVELQP